MTATNPPHATTGHDGESRILAAILILALALRVIAAMIVPDQHFPDATDYRVAGHALWTTAQLGASHIMPLYPALVGLVGPGWGQLVLDIALSVAMVWLVHRLTLAVFADRAAAMLAALAAAIYPYFIFYAVVGLTETLFIVLLLGAFLCWYRGAFLMAAVFAVLSVLTRPTIDPLVPLLILYFALVIHRMPIASAFRQLALYIAVYCILMAPWWLHNYRAYGTFVRLNLGSGIMLYSGNNPLNRSGGGLADIDADRRRFDVIADPIARDRAMWNAGISYINENRKRFIELAGIKFLRFWRLWPYAPEYSMSFYVAASIASFLPVLLLAVVYLVAWGWRVWPQTLPIVLFAAYLTAVHMVLNASLRYRLPLEPFLIVFAAVAVARLARRWQPTRSILNRLAAP